MVDDPLVKLIWIKNEERIDAAQKEPGNRAGGGRGGAGSGVQRRRSSACRSGIRTAHHLPRF